MLDQRPNPGVSEFLAEAHINRAFISGQAPKVALRNAGDLRADLGFVRLLRAAV
jgi:hypothetical protein